MSSGPNRINQTPTTARIDSAESVGRVTPRSSFGDRVKDNLATAGGAVATGVGVAAQYIPGGAILSAALSGATQFANANSSGQSQGRPGAYYMSGVVGSGSAVPVPGSVSVGSGAAPSTPSSGVTTGGTVPAGGMSIPSSGAMPNPMDVLQAQAASNMQFLMLQHQMSQENQRFSTLSNVMKTRHDTASNTIRNLH